MTNKDTTQRSDVGPPGRLSFVSQHLWLICIVFGLAGLPLYLWLGPALEGLLYIFYGGVAATAIVVGVRLNRPDRRWPWYVFAAALVSSSIGDIIYYYYDFILVDVAPWPSPADAFYFGYYVIAAYGFHTLLQHGSRRRNLGGLIDAGIVTASAALLSWTFLISPYVNDPSLPGFHVLVAISPPVGDLLVLAMLVRFAFTNPNRVPTFLLLATGITLNLVTDTIYGTQVLAGTYVSGGMLDFGWMIGSITLGASALHPSMRTFPTLKAGVYPGLSLRRLLLLSGIPIASLTFIQVEGVLAGHAHAEVMIPGALGLFLLAVCRVALLAREVSEANADMRVSQERFELMSRATNDAVWDWDLVTGSIIFSDAINTTFGHPVHHQRVMSIEWWTSLIHPDDVVAVSNAMNDTLEGDSISFAVDYRMRCGNGEYVHVIDRSFIVRDDTGKPVRMVGSITDVSKQKTLEQQLAHQAFHDALTGLSNRTLFRSRVEHALNQTERRGDRVAVLFIDLDRFKHVNDSLGHDAGDRLLVEVSHRLRSCVRPSDTLSRRGGDEFTILLEDIDESQAIVVADRIRDVLKAPIHVAGQDVFVTASVGIAIGAPGNSHADGLIRDADVAMYSAKVNGRAKHELFDGSSDPFTVEALKLEVDLRRAVERNEFIVHYQPMVDLGTGRPMALEALVRWEHPERGLVSPAEFLDIAEETGLIVPIGRQVRARVCQQIAEWTRAFPGAAIVPVYINCSPTEFQQPDLVAGIAEDLRRFGLNGEQLGIEITEHVAIVDLAAASATIDGLRKLGVRLALDDFGSGNAGLSHLLRLQVDILKLDKRFTSGLDAATNTTLLTRAIIELGRSLNMEVLTEGIETSQQAEALVRLGSALGQGYYFARPMPATEIDPRLTGIRVGLGSGHVAAG